MLFPFELDSLTVKQPPLCAAAAPPLLFSVHASDLCFMSQQVSFSEGGPGSNSTGSEVASMSSQLPDTPNSMVSSPIEA